MAKIKFGGMVVDKRIRSIVKAISWRVVAVLVTFIVSFIVIGKVLIAASIGLLDSFIKIFAYYLHERVWGRVDYGRESLEMRRQNEK